MCQPKLGARGVGQRLDCIVGFAVGLQQVQQNLAGQAEMEHLAWREVACNVPPCGKSLQHKHQATSWLSLWFHPRRLANLWSSDHRMLGLHASTCMQWLLLYNQCYSSGPSKCSDLHRLISVSVLNPPVCKSNTVIPIYKYPVCRSDAICCGFAYQRVHASRRMVNPYRCTSYMYMCICMYMYDLVYYTP